MKKVAYVLGGLILLYLILALAGPSNIKVERSIVINKSGETLKSVLGDFKFFHDNWSPWTEKDPAMVNNYSGKPGEIGHRYEWSGNKEVGKGAMELVSMQGDSINQKLSFEGEGDSKAYYVVKSSGDTSNITWGVSFDIGFMGRPFMLFMNMDKMMGADFESGLGKLKKAIESMPATAPTANYTVQEIDWTERTFIGKRATLKFEAMKEFFGTNYPRIFEELGKAKMEPTMAPSAIYWTWEQEKGQADCAAVACVPFGTKVKGWESFDMIAAKVLQIAYYGAYEKSMDAHMAMDAYMKAKNLPMQSYVVEEYVTDPMTEKDTAKWLTNIYYVLPGTK